jgi:CRISPR/Cas system-associated exonuclease Cas4 (RecB family)
VTATANEPLTTSELLLRWDADRPRSLQRELGWSDLGVCRRRVGYRLADVEPTNAGGSIQAVMGTAIHMVQEQALNRYVPEASTEEEVTFAGILGHLDRYEDGDVIDTKSTSSRWLQTIKRDGPPKSNLWQINGYAAALIASGRPVRRVILDYIARDTGEEFRWTGQPDPRQVREALVWLKEVRDTELAWLPREFEPDSQFCKGCAFLDICWPEGEPHRDRRAVLFQEDPDAAKWIAKLEEARADKAAAVKREAEAKGALDALRPNTSGTFVLDVGAPKHLRWTVSTSNKLDGDRVRADYKAAEAAAPTKPSTSVTLTLVTPESEEDDD